MIPLSHFLRILVVFINQGNQMKRQENRKPHFISFLVFSYFETLIWYLFVMRLVWFGLVDIFVSADAQRVNFNLNEKKKTHLNKTKFDSFILSFMCRIFITSDLNLINKLGCSLPNRKEKKRNDTH